MTLISESIFSTALIDILKAIHFELKRSNELTETSNEITRKMHESFFQEQRIIEGDIDDAIGQARNVNNNFNALNRKIDQSEAEDK